MSIVNDSKMIMKITTQVKGNNENNKHASDYEEQKVKRDYINSIIPKLQKLSHYWYPAAPLVDVEFSVTNSPSLLV